MLFEEIQWKCIDKCFTILSFGVLPFEMAVN